MSTEYMRSPEEATQTFETPTLSQSAKLWERLHNSPQGKELAKTSLDEYSKKAFSDTLQILSQTFKAKNIPLDMARVESRIRSAIEQVMLNPDIPNLAKQKFIKDITERLLLLKDLNMSDVVALRRRRAVESFGVEPLELNQKFGNDETKKQQFYLDKIFDETIANYIEPVSYSLKEVFSWDKVTKITGREYQRESIEKTTRLLTMLDQRYGLNFAGDAQILSFLDGKTDARTKILADIQKWLLQKHPNGIWLGEMLRNGVISDAIRKWAEIQVQGKTINIIDAYQQYHSVISQANATEVEARQIRSTALDTSLTSRVKEAFSMDQLKSEFDRIKPADIQEKIKGKSLADMVIIATQLAQLAPVVGDIWWGLDGIVTSYTGMNVDWVKIQALDRALNAIFWVLWISVISGVAIGGIAARAMKAQKLKWLLSSFEILKKELPQKLAEFTKSGGVMPEAAQKMLEALFPAIKPQHFVSPAPRTNGSEVRKVAQNNWPDASKVQAAERRSGISSSEVMANAKLWDEERLKLAEKLLWGAVEKMSPDDRKILYKTILDLHHNTSRGVYQNTTWELRIMAEELRKLGINKAQLRSLMENGVLGSIGETKQAAASVGKSTESGVLRSTAETKQVSSLPKVSTDPDLKAAVSRIGVDGVVGYLEKFEGKEINQTTLTAVMIELRGSEQASTPQKLMDYLKDGFEIRLPKWSESEMMLLAQKTAEAHYIETSIQNIGKVKNADMQALCFKNGSLEHASLFQEFLNKGAPEEVQAFMNQARKTWENFLPTIASHPQALNAFTTKISKDTVLFDQMILPLIDALPKSADPSTIKNLKQALLDAKKRGTSISAPLLQGAEAKMELLAKANSPEANLKAFMNGLWDRELQLKNLKTPHSPMRNIWNSDFELLRGVENWLSKQIEMIKRWEQWFFSEFNMWNFFGSTFMELEKSTQKELVALMKSDGPYSEIPRRFASFRRYATEEGLL